MVAAAHASHPLLTMHSSASKSRYSLWSAVESCNLIAHCKDDITLDQCHYTQAADCNTHEKQERGKTVHVKEYAVQHQADSGGTVIARGPAQLSTPKACSKSNRHVL
jgi:hypothetical protein